MDKRLSQVGLDGLNLMFKALKMTGKLSYLDIDKLLAILCIDDLILTSSELITENDARCISKAVNCLLGTSCLLPYPIKINCKAPSCCSELDTKLTQSGSGRITEDTVFWRRMNFDKTTRPLIKSFCNEGIDTEWRIFDFTFDNSFE